MSFAGQQKINAPPLERIQSEFESVFLQESVDNSQCTDSFGHAEDTETRVRSIHSQSVQHELGTQSLPGLYLCPPPINPSLIHSLQISQQQDQKNVADNDNNSQGDANNCGAGGNAAKAAQTAISEALIGDISNHRILSYQDKAPVAPEGYINSLKVLYSSTKPGNSAKKPSRFLPTSADRILDAPDIMDDYYLQLLDWSSNNVLAVALSGELYLWNAVSGDITNLVQFPESEYISSVAWVEHSNNVAIGTSSGEIHIWDATKSVKLRTMRGHTSRVSSLSWNAYLLSSGCRTGAIFHHDARIAQHHVSTLLGHSQDVCGLKWNQSKSYLASGGNDNVVNIWSSQMVSNNASPVYTFTDHQAAVKAIDWCPWKPNLLATGGGTNDRCIKIWNVNNGRNMYSLSTNSQVSAILWSKEYKELISSHGFSKNELIIWKYPSLSKVAELSGHTGRILGMSMSPDGSTVVSLGADETLRFWNCFQVDAESKKKEEMRSQRIKIANNPLRQSIR